MTTACLERRAAPNAAQLIQPLFDPVGEAIRRFDLAVVFPSHRGQTRGGSDRQEFIHQGLLLGNRSFQHLLNPIPPFVLEHHEPATVF